MTLNIILGKKDLVLARWYSLINGRYKSQIAREVISRYIAGRPPLLIGKIHIGPEAKASLADSFSPQPFGIPLDEGEMTRWAAGLKEGGGKPGPLVKDLLKKSILLVGSPEEEWVPDYIDLDSMLNKFYDEGDAASRQAAAPPMNQAPPHPVIEERPQERRENRKPPSKGGPLSSTMPIECV